MGSDATTHQPDENPVRRQLCCFGHAGEASVDGAQIKVQWHGRPTPNYPGACDPTKPGVQFVFGGRARIDWHDAALFTELCASSQSTFPNAWTSTGNGPSGASYPVPANSDLDTKGHTNKDGDLGIAIYGLTEDQTPAEAYPLSTNTLATNYNAGSLGQCSNTVNDSVCNDIIGTNSTTIFYPNYT